ncbi:MAG: hypothetical protein ACK5RG_05750 [Cyclobacteriaceae bacterium]|jgi:hypothetical protein
MKKLNPPSKVLSFTVLSFAVLLMVASESKAQTDSTRYDYAILQHIYGGKVEFRFDSKQQALEKEYESQKLRNLMDAVYFLEDKGWTLINFTAAPTGIGVPEYFAFLKKKR